MDHLQGTYSLTAQAYATGVRKLFHVGTAAGRVERGAPGHLDANMVSGQALQLEWISRNLTWAAASALDDKDPRTRAEASVRLLAKVAVDLQVSAFLLEVAQQSEPSAAFFGGPERSWGMAIPSGLEENLAIITGQAVVGGAAAAAEAAGMRFVERKITPPADLPKARAQLSEMVTSTLEQIEARAGRTAQAALSGLLTLGVGQVFKAAGIVGTNIASTFGAAEKVSQIYQLFRQFFFNAYNALVSLLGEDLSRAAANQVAAWVNDMVQGEKFTSLLEKLYETGRTRQELCQLVDASPAGLEKYADALNSLDELNAQYLKQISVIEKLITALRFVPGIPAAVMPQAQLLLGATYILLCGYVIFAGADFVDAPKMPRLDRIPGPRRILTGSLPPAPQPKPQTTPRSYPQAPPKPPQAPPQPGTEAKPQPGPPARDEEPAAAAPDESESTAKDLPGGVSFGAGSAQTIDEEGITGVHGPPGGPPASAVETTATDETTTGMIEEKIRLDVAAPHAPVIVGDTFEIAVAIRRPKSEKLSLDGLSSVVSGDGVIYRRESSELVRYRVVVTAPECDIAAAEYPFILRSGRDSPPRFFQLTPKRSGSLSIIVTAFQEGDLVAQTRVRVTAAVEVKEAERVSAEETRRQLVEELTVRPKDRARPARVREFIDLDIELFDYEIDEQQVERYRVRVVCDLCGQQKLADADQVVIPPRVRGQLNLLKRRQLTQEETVDLGKQLGQMLLPPKARWYFQRARTRLDEDEMALRIRVKVDQYPLANIAWEYAYLAPDDAPPNYSDPEGFLVLDRHLSLVRYEVMGQPVVDLDPVGENALRMVMLLSNSSEPQFPRLNLTQERKNITQALENMTGIDLECFTNASIQTLQDALEHPASIFHFAGHGTFQGELGPIRGTLDGEGYLVLKGRTPRESLFSARKLALNLKGRGVRLAVLGVCEGGERDPVNAWTGIAPALARAGIPAVVAMQFSVYDESAIAFHRAFYRALALGYPVDTAVSNGRLAIYNLPASDRDWGVPVLYLRCDDGVLFPKE